MPMYEARCHDCGKPSTYFRSIADRDKDLVCPLCGGLVQRMISAPFVHASFQPYNCPITDIPITSRSEHEANLRKHGCRVLEEGESRSAVQAVEAKHEAFVERVAETAAQVAASMPLDKQQDLARDLEQNFDVNFARETALAVN